VVAEGSLVPGHPGVVCRVWLLDDDLVFVGDGDELCRWLLCACQEALEACRTYGR
jgi:hypothetical protein